MFNNTHTWKTDSNLIGKDKCSFQVIQSRRGLIQCKEVTNQTEHFLELFSWTLNYFVPKRCESIIIYYCFDHPQLFWPNAQCHLQGLNKLFLPLMYAICFCIILICYLIFSCMLYDFSHAIWNKLALVNCFNDHKLHPPYRLMQFC